MGDIETYPGYTASAPSTSFTRPPATTSEPWTLPAASQFPLASGTAEDCVSYQNYRDMGIMTQLGPGHGMVDLNVCTSVASLWNIGLSSLIAWNPSLSEDNCALQAGLSYCVGVEDELGRLTGISGLFHIPLLPLLDSATPCPLT